LIQINAGSWKVSSTDAGMTVDGIRACGDVLLALSSRLLIGAPLSTYGGF